MHAESLQSCPTLCDPIDCNLPGSSVRGSLQARILEWVAISYARGSSQPRDRTQISYISCTGSQVLYHYCYLGSPFLPMLTTLVISSDLISLLYMPSHNFTTCKFYISISHFYLKVWTCTIEAYWICSFRFLDTSDLLFLKWNSNLPPKTSQLAVFSASVLAALALQLLKPKILVILNFSPSLPFSLLFYTSRYYFFFL